MSLTTKDILLSLNISTYNTILLQLLLLDILHVHTIMICLLRILKDIQSFNYRLNILAYIQDFGLTDNGDMLSLTNVNTSPSYKENIIILAIQTPYQEVLLYILKTRSTHLL